jgi:hypothetical protein
VRQGRVVHAVRRAGHLVLVGQPWAEQQRVVRAEGDRGARLDEGAQRHVGVRGVDAQGHVAGGADLECDVVLDEPCQHPGVLARPHAVAEAVRAQGVEGVLDVIGAEQLAAVRHERQPRPARDVERRREVRRPAPALVVAQAEPDHRGRALAREPCGEAGQGPGLQRVAGAGGGDDHADPRARRCCRLARGVQHDLERGRDAADERRVRRRVDLHL